MNNNTVDLNAYKKAKARKAELEPYIKLLVDFSDKLWDNLDKTWSFAIIKVVESAKIQYMMEIHECELILNSHRTIFKYKGKK